MHHCANPPLRPSVALPVDIHSTSATYDTQYGLIDRPTHRNTTVDQAKFEVVAHRFADLSETGYGVSAMPGGTRSRSHIYAF